MQYFIDLILRQCNIVGKWYSIQTYTILVFAKSKKVNTNIWIFEERGIERNPKRERLIISGIVLINFLSVLSIQNRYGVLSKYYMVVSCKFFK